MDITKATPNDTIRIKQLLDDNFDRVLAKHHSKKVMEKYKASNSIDSIKSQLVWKDVYVIKEASIVLGTVGLANFGTKDEPKYSVSNLYIDVDEQSKGLGTKLINHIIDKAYEKELEVLHVPSSRNAVSFYEKSGFTIDEAQPDAEDEITWMTKEL